MRQRQITASHLRVILCRLLHCCCCCRCRLLRSRAARRQGCGPVGCWCQQSTDDSDERDGGGGRRSRLSIHTVIIVIIVVLSSRSLLLSSPAAGAHRATSPSSMSPVHTCIQSAFPPTSHSLQDTGSRSLGLGPTGSLNQCPVYRCHPRLGCDERHTGTYDMPRNTACCSNGDMGLLHSARGKEQHARCQDRCVGEE